MTFISRVDSKVISDPTLHWRSEATTFAPWQSWPSHGSHGELFCEPWASCRRSAPTPRFGQRGYHTSFEARRKSS